MYSSSISRWFEYESGHAWCESAYKYQTLPYVAEFANTCTNLPIIVLPLVNIMLLRRYLHDVNGGLVFPQLLLTFNGLASTYYHATLNLFGQLVDELSLVWIITVFLVVYIPVMKWFPERFSKRLTVVRWVVLIVTAVVSALCFLEPNLNAIALMLFSIPAAVVIRYEGKQSGIPDIENFPSRILALWGVAFSFWFADRLLCDFWLYLGTPYLHAAFHLLAGLAGYTIFIMFSMIDIESRSKTHRYTAAVRYFPDKNGSIFSFPYISLKERSHKVDVPIFDSNGNTKTVTDDIPT
ncbi:hypothetical protein B9Z55_019903 [Caenorhabditis nigoni]|uniref:Alkaline ceramidase n=1 Tax=Caenorhabditis nigoni TaxID=1611254 RepID=A0A2G5TKE2_9PELO|nr:hypothetical protein B9Z55_019903 [Caenorhabditis nigoni]